MLFTVVTWNIWFSRREWRKRLEKVLSEILPLHNNTIGISYPDAICFQEVTSDAHEYMLQHSSLRERYEPTEPCGLPHHYDVSIWIQKSNQDGNKIMRWQTWSIPLKSDYGRRGLCLDLEIAIVNDHRGDVDEDEDGAINVCFPPKKKYHRTSSGDSNSNNSRNMIALPVPSSISSCRKRVRLVNVHLESGKKMASTREHQLRQLFCCIRNSPWKLTSTSWQQKQKATANFLATNNAAETPSSDIMTSILLGDFNIDPCTHPEENLSIEDNGVDIWKFIRPDDHGFTMDTCQNKMLFYQYGKRKRTRYDRIILMKAQQHEEHQQQKEYNTGNSPLKERGTITMAIPRSIERLGIYPLEDGKRTHEQQLLWASDHFGLVACMHLFDTPSNIESYRVENRPPTFVDGYKTP